MPSTADYLDSLVARGIIGGDALERVLGGQPLPGPPQRQSRGEIFGQQVDELKDYLTPSYLRDTPVSPQAYRALADPNAKPGKIGPPSGPPTTAQMIGGFAGDVALNALPFGKFLAAGVPWLAADAAKFSSMVKRGTSLLELGEAFPNRSPNALKMRLIQEGTPLSGSEGYVNQRAWWSDPEKHDRAMELLDQRVGRRQAAKELGISEAGWRRWLDTMGVQESPGIEPTHWDNPQNVELLKTQAGQRLTQREMAAEHGISERAIQNKLGRMRDAGELQGYAPQGGYGLTPAGRTPTRPALRFMEGKGPDTDEEASKAVIDFLRSRGLHVEADQLSQFG